MRGLECRAASSCQSSEAFDMRIGSGLGRKGAESWACRCRDQRIGVLRDGGGARLLMAGI